jgi:2-dehydropantoate 2-reductase
VGVYAPIFNEAGLTALRKESKMRILVVGAGAIGGYFGGRLLEAGRDVTFLVRQRRAAELARTGLAIRSRLGDVDIAAPQMVTAAALGPAFDLVLLSCKAYDLNGAIESFAPAIGSGTAILPLLNGMHHLDVLNARFGAERVLGGQCLISTMLDGEGRILHLVDTHSLTFGEQSGRRTARADAIAATLANARFTLQLSDDILQEMWEKWVFIATTAGVTCLMRSAIGDIVAAGAADLASSLLEEVAGIAASPGFAPRAAFLERTRAMITAPGSPITTSMLRDIERGAPVEADHILGDLLRRAGDPSRTPLLRIAYAHTKAYEARRAREQAGKAT